MDRLELMAGTSGNPTGVSRGSLKLFQSFGFGTSSKLVDNKKNTEAFPKLQFLEDKPCLSSNLRFSGKSGLLAAFPKAIPKTNRVLGMALQRKDFL
jgi:hypothetical protein